MTMLSPAESQLARFSRQHLVLQPQLSVVGVRRASKMGPLHPHCPGTGASLLEVENPTGREFNFSLSRTRRVAVSLSAIHQIGR
jgi:hypothetical protein